MASFLKNCCYELALAGNNRVRQIGGIPTTVKIPISASSYIVYPNPANKNIIIEAPEEMTSVSISNLQGVVIKTYAFTDNCLQEQIDIHDLPTGIYLVNVNKKWIQELIKE